MKKDRVKVKNLAVLRFEIICQMLGVSRGAVYDWLNPNSPRHDPTFPRPISLTGKTVGFLAHEIDEWILSRPRVEYYAEQHCAEQHES